MQSFLSDLRYAARELRHRPGFALTAIISLALGIGATSAVFSVIYGILLNPFPYKDSHRMMQITMVDTAGRNRGAGMSGAQLDELRKLANGRECRRGVRLEPHDDRWRHSGGRRRLVRHAEFAESLGHAGASRTLAHPGGRPGRP